MYCLNFSLLAQLGGELRLKQTQKIRKTNQKTKNLELRRDEMKLKSQDLQKAYLGHKYLTWPKIVLTVFQDPKTDFVDILLSLMRCGSIEIGGNLYFFHL